MYGEKVLILDFGGKQSQMLARCARDHHVYCEVMPFNVSFDEIKEKGYRGIIISDVASRADELEMASCAEALGQMGIPVLEMQQYTDIQGAERDDLLNRFLHQTCGCGCEWEMSSFIDNAVEEIRQQVGDKRVICGLSGGVDSSVSALLVHKAVGKQLTCIFVDHGLMRKNEPDEVERVFKDIFDVEFIRVDASERFLKKLSGVIDPEKKRKIIGEEFIRVFEEEALKIGNVDFLVQGTIYPDIIESGVGKFKAVKSHHNVGGLPEIMKLALVEPVKYLFKDEVRKAGLALGLPEFLAMRQPFPGPGLGVRVIGEITKEKLDTLRDADFIFREEIAFAGLDKTISQYFAIHTGLNSVGAKNSERTYDTTIALRAVITSDFMTAQWAEIPYAVLKKVSTRIGNEVKGVSRVVYDISGKPPATVEWE